MKSLPEELLVYIFDYCEGYNYVNRNVCKDWKRIIPETLKIHYIDSLCKDDKIPENYLLGITTEECIANGCIYILDHLKDKITENICVLAAKHNQRKVLEWARKNGYQWDEDICSVAAEHRNYGLLKWLHKNKCPWSYWTCPRIAENGDLEMLKWARENGWFYRFAIKFFTKHSFVKNSWDEQTFAGAAGYGCLEMIKWFKDNDCPFNEDVFHQAACVGNLEILKWLKENGFPYDETVFCGAATNENKKVLEWCKEHEFPMDYRSCSYSRDLETLKWLKENGCPWNNEVCFSFVIFDKDIEMLKWAMENGCPYDSRTLEAAKKYNKKEMVEWLNQRNILN